MCEEYYYENLWCPKCTARRGFWRDKLGNHIFKCETCGFRIKEEQYEKYRKKAVRDTELELRTKALFNYLNTPLEELLK